MTQAFFIPIQTETLPPSCSSLSFRSAGEKTAPAQLCQKWKERQAEDGEVVTVHFLEQLNPEALELITANRLTNRIAGLDEVFRQERRRKVPHRQVGGLHMRPGNLTILGEDHG